MGYPCDWTITSEPPIGDWCSDGVWDDDSDDFVESTPPKPEGLGETFEFYNGIAGFDSWTWRTHRQDMILLSSVTFPDVLFHVECRMPWGDGTSHHWYKDGKSYHWHPTNTPPTFTLDMLE